MYEVGQLLEHARLLLGFDTVAVFLGWPNDSLFPILSRRVRLKVCEMADVGCVFASLVLGHDHLAILAQCHPALVPLVCFWRVIQPPGLSLRPRLKVSIALSYQQQGEGTVGSSIHAPLYRPESRKHLINFWQAFQSNRQIFSEINPDIGRRPIVWGFELGRHECRDGVLSSILISY